MSGFFVDPIGYRDGVNPYSYVAESPVADLDPLGTCKVLSVKRFINNGQAYSQLDKDVAGAEFSKLAGNFHLYGEKKETGVEHSVGPLIGWWTEFRFFVVLPR